MKRRPLAAAFTSLLLSLSLFAPASDAPAAQGPTPPQAGGPAPARQQQPTTPQDVTSDSEDEVVRITSNLVQIDAVVTDDKGRRVTDLRPEDFEVVVGDRGQQITNFSYISDEPSAGTDAAGRPASSPGLLPPARTRLRPGQVRRTVAFVVDNLCASFEDVHYARESIRKFVNGRMQPNDLVAVIQTIGGTGVMQQFTADKRLVLAAVEGVRFNSSSSRARLCGLEELAPFDGDPLSLAPLPGQATPNTEQKVAGDVGQDRENIFKAGTLGALNFILKGL